jgi:hypothetical protein
MLFIEPAAEKFSSPISSKIFWLTENDNLRAEKQLEKRRGMVTLDHYAKT